MQDFTTIHNGVVHVTPEQVNYNPARLVQLDNHFQKLIQNQKIQGAGYLLSRKDMQFSVKLSPEFLEFTAKNTSVAIF